MPTRAPGLDEAQARQRLADRGPNAIPVGRRGGALAHAWRQLATEPMFLLLLGAAALYFVLGDRAEGALLGVFAVVTVMLVLVQNQRSRRALDALRALAAPQARVLRGGQVRRCPATEVVVGDWLLLEEGERVAADAVLHEAHTLAVDESLLTGESVPVDKAVGDTVAGSTLVVGGHGAAEVIATGAMSQAGRIGALLDGIDTVPTRLQRQTARLTRVLGLAAVAVSVALVALMLARGHSWIQSLLSAIAVSMALLPEEFVLAMTVFLVIGAWRLAQQQVLVRRAAVIETLGATTVLAVDKTGTLTENRMTLRLVRVNAGEWAAGAQAALPEVSEVLRVARRASREHASDPLDRALLAGMQRDAAPQGASAAPAGDHAAVLVHQHPLAAGQPFFVAVWRDRNGSTNQEATHASAPELVHEAMHEAAHEAAHEATHEATHEAALEATHETAHEAMHEAACKGAAEAVLALCALPQDERALWLRHAAELAGRGLRVLGVAHARTHDGSAMPAQPQGWHFEWLGLVAFEDPLRASVPDAVRAAREAGATVMMVTGDAPATALEIARQAGLDAQAALTGKEIDAMDDGALAAAVASVRVFARVTPQHKLRLVRALQARGEVVAMTGDGVNDAPALRAADVGIGMGARGTEVAREAAALVLLDDDFGSIVRAVGEGRRIFDNLRKVMLYIVAIHVPIAGLALLPLLLGWPPLLLPAHVALTEMVIDTLCTLGYEALPAEAGHMRRRPRAVGEPLIGRAQVALAVAQGATLLGVCLAVYGGSLGAGWDDDAARAMAFVTMTAGNLTLALVNASQHPLGRGGRPPRAFAWIALIAAAGTTLALAVPALRSLFAFAWPGGGAMVLAMACGVVGMAAWDLAKRWPRVSAALGAMA